MLRSNIKKSYFLFFSSNGTFIVDIKGDSGVEEEKMIGVDLKIGILMEIVVDTGETCRTYRPGK